MAKKDVQAELSQEELEAKFSEGEDNKKEPKKIKIKTKSTFSLDDYKKDKGVEDGAKMKPETWIKMSPAFQDVTGLPGIICNSISLVHGKSDSTKSTMALELARCAQEQGMLPVFIITERKWSVQRCVDMGVDMENCIVNTDIDFIEGGCDFIEELLKDQEEGRLPHDLVFIWDSIGATPSKKEWEASEEGGESKGMMVTAKVLRDRISRRIFHKITSTKKESYPFNATLFVVNQSYVTPPAFIGAMPTLTAAGGEALTYSASLIFRLGNVSSTASKVKATKDGVQLAFASKVKLTVTKNHCSEICNEGFICAGRTGYFPDTKEALEEYKKTYKGDWNLEFDKDWNRTSKD